MATDDARTALDPRDDTALVLAARTSEPSAYGVLFQRWFDRCYDVAWNISRNRETAAEVTQDAFLAGWEGLGDLRDPTAFGGWILRATRNRALNRLARDRGRQDQPLGLQTEERWAMTDTLADPAAASEIAERQRLVWTASRALGARDLSLIDLHLRHGLEPAEIAEELGVTANNAHQLLFRLRGKLRDAIGAVLLWRQGSPACPGLAALVPAQAGFDEQTAATIRRHQRDCTPCTSELSAQTHPERLFAALPITLAPLAVRDEIQARLVALGIPVQTPPTGDAGDAGDAGNADPRTGQTRRAMRILIAATLAAVIAAGVGAAITMAGRTDPVDLRTATATPTAAQAGAGGQPSLAPVATGARPVQPSASTAPITTSTGAGTIPDPVIPPTRTGTPTPTNTAVAVAPRVAVSASGPVDLTLPNRCRSRQLRWVIAWRITNATKAALTLPHGQLQIEPANGSSKLCLAPGDSVTLTATGPGGTGMASDTATLTPQR